jgi:hypothetical protein
MCLMASGCSWVTGGDYGSPMVADAGPPVAVIAIKPVGD